MKRLFLSKDVNIDTIGCFSYSYRDEENDESPSTLMKKFKKQKAKNAENPNEISVQALEQKAKADLALQNYRKAKEWLKELCRRDKDRYLSQLVECYALLARQMTEKGQISEAKTVYDQMKTLTGGVVDLFSEITMAAGSGDYQGAAEAVVSHYAKGNGPLSAETGRIAADTLITAFQDFPRLKEVNAQLYAEAGAIRKALEHVSAERFQDALDELRPIGLQSLFAGWRLFVKGLCAFYTGDDSRALEAFIRLRGEPLLSRASRPFMFVIDPDGAPVSRDDPKEPLLRQVCAVLGRPDMAFALPRAEYLWQTGRHVDSYDYVARTLAGFPTESSGVERTLTLFYFNVPFHMDLRRADKYLRGIYHTVKKSGALDHVLYRRVRNLHLDKFEGIYHEDYLGLWKEFFTSYRHVHGENPKLQALIYAHLGNVISGGLSDSPDGQYFRRRKTKSFLKDCKLAEEAYEKSLGLNGDDKDIHLAILRLHEATGDKGKRNKRLDEISRRFPDDKDILVMNGSLCIERKAFVKGIEYLKRAIALDPLDRSVREVLGAAFIRASLHFADKGNVQRYRELMQEALGMAQSGLENMTLGRPYLLGRLAVLEWMTGHDKEADRAMAEAIGESGDEARLAYFVYLIGRIYGLKEPHISRLKKLVSRFFENPEPTAAAVFCEILSYVNRISLPKPWIRREFDLLSKYATGAATKAGTLFEAEKIVRFALERQGAGLNLARLYIRKALRQDPRHPMFLYFEYLCETDGNTALPTRDHIKRLKEILVIALERNERLLVDTLNRTIRMVQAELSSPFGGYNYEEDDDDPGGDFIDDDDDDDDEFKQIIEEVERALDPFKKPRRQNKTGSPDKGQESLFDFD